MAVHACGGTYLSKRLCMYMVARIRANGCACAWWHIFERTAVHARGGTYSSKWLCVPAAHHSCNDAGPKGSQVLV
eukprot:357204-Chlamydomonas_euryale.AAC.4